LVAGRVQGVGYRYFVVESAMALSLTGWARNQPDGSVEVIAEGPHSALSRLITDLWRGPRSSRVTQVTVNWTPASGEFHQFSIRG